MIKKLRRKFVAVVMGAAAVILLTVFAVLAITTETGLRAQSMELLNNALYGAPHRMEQPLTEEKPEPPRKLWDDRQTRDRSPYFTALVDSEGGVTLEDKAAVLLADFSEEEIEELAQSVAARAENSGNLPAYRLRYAKRETEAGVLIAFGDTSLEHNSLMELVKNSLIVGALTLLVLFGASIMLARWAVRPVEKAWNQQKQFVGDASHELKTPLTVILSNADMLLNHSGEGSENRRWAENIKAEGLRMKKLTEELLSLARSEDAARRPEMSEVDLSYLVTDSALSFEPAAFEGGHELVCHVEPGLSLQGDAAGLSQLCGILLDNALKYASPKGEIRVALEGVGKCIRLSVSNEGEAIPEEDLSRIFERFYRSDPSRHGEGHGLGLAIARQVAELHKGKIWAESKGGVNTFTVLFPAPKNR